MATEEPLFNQKDIDDSNGPVETVVDGSGRTRLLVRDDSDEDDDGLNVSPVPGTRVVYFWKPLLNGSSPDMGVNGSSTTQTFEAGPAGSEVWYLERLSFLIHDPGSMDSQDFGSISGNLSNGLQVAFDLNGSETEFTNMTNNTHISQTFTGLAGVSGEDSSGWLDDDDWFSGYLHLHIPIEMRGADSDKVLARVRDNITALRELQMCALFWKAV